ncbi:peptidase, M28 family [Bacteriovorax sp. BSW11_IV]|uniref:M20/M25/M40 family metallo-hydrolase n=1 Tax=Bacteriovorax sp. BSW11_IV TaxID=1353529 RepID=UPI00038A2A86|nr:M20/M25/M40 family metallo-hydrolase [Bacteriovorax sp. BSW11_IV]EQC48409.1 peptidase, M28 family [Bacteriovorax sp. BSW11_IV]
MFKILILLTLSLTNHFVLANEAHNTLKFLASDQLEGRRPGTPGSFKAINFISQKLSQYSVKTLGDSYLQEFTIFTQMEKEGVNSLKIGPNTISSFEPLAFSFSGAIESELIFVGHGISIPKNDERLVYDDYEGLDVEGKIVVVMTGDPGDGNKQSLFRNPDYISYRTLFYKIKNAALHGAKGVLVIQDPLSVDGKEKVPYFNKTEGGGHRFAIMAGLTTNEAINSLLKKTTTLEIQKMIAKTQRPMSLSLAPKAKLSVHLKKITGRVSNVVGVIEGSDPLLKNEVLVLGAHFDHLGYGGQNSMEPNHDPVIHNGADDNASGSAMILELARLIAKKPLKRTVMVAFFNAEESGLLGSTHFVDSWAQYSEKYGQLYAMLNFDMVGRYQNELAILGTETAFEWESELESFFTKDFGINIVQKKKSVGSSDHAPFIDKKIPALFFTTGTHEDYHKSSDDSEKINYKAFDKTTNMAYELLVQSDVITKLTFNPEATSDDGAGRERGYGAHLGCVPQFGQDDSIVGVVCMRASVESPAEKAGIIAGDILVGIGDIEVKTIYDLAFALKFYRAGDEIELRWQREGVLMKKLVTLTKSTRSKRELKKNTKTYGHHPMRRLY